jgi:ankyrin repeat protein
MRLAMPYLRAVELHAAVRAGDIRGVRRLLAAGARVDQRGPALDTPLHVAAALGHERIAALLIEHGAKIDARNTRKETPLHLAAATASRKVVRLLLEAGARAAAASGARDTPLHECAGRADAQHARIAIATALLDAGCPIDAANRSGQTALWRAAANGDLGVVRKLLARGANPSRRAKGQQGTALDAAQMFHQPHVAALLAKHLR